MSVGQLVGKNVRGERHTFRKAVAAAPGSTLSSCGLALAALLIAAHGAAAQPGKAALRPELPDLKFFSVRGDQSAFAGQRRFITEAPTCDEIRTPPPRQVRRVVWDADRHGFKPPDGFNRAAGLRADGTTRRAPDIVISQRPGPLVGFGELYPAVERCIASLGGAAVLIVRFEEDSSVGRFGAQPLELIGSGDTEGLTSNRLILWSERPISDAEARVLLAASLGRYRLGGQSRPGAMRDGTEGSGLELRLRRVRRSYTDVFDRTRQEGTLEASIANLGTADVTLSLGSGGAAGGALAWVVDGAAAEAARGGPADAVTEPTSPRLRQFEIPAGHGQVLHWLPKLPQMAPGVHRLCLVYMYPRGALPDEEGAARSADASGLLVQVPVAARRLLSNPVRIRVNRSGIPGGSIP